MSVSALAAIARQASRVVCALFVAALMVSCADRDAAPEQESAAGRLVLYTSLPLQRVTAVADAFRAASGINVDFLLDDDAVLVDKLERKEHIPSADVLLISGVGHLARAVESDVLRPVGLSMPNAQSVSDLHDADGYWYAVGVRAEWIVYNADAVNGADLQGYTDLGGARWRGRLCLQRGSAERSRSLVAALVAALGERQAELTVRGWRANLAASVFDEQADMLSAVDSGDCAVAIAGSDQAAAYLERHRGAGPTIHAPAAEHGGTVRNVTAAGVARHAGNAEHAQRFLEWLLSEHGQRALHRYGSEFSLSAEVDRPPLDAWQGFAPGPVGPSRAAYHYPDAVRLIERARYR